MKKTRTLFLIPSLKTKALKCASVFLSLISITFAEAETFRSDRFDLLLAGGALKTCSSMSVRNCQDFEINPDDKQAVLYEINTAASDRFAKIASKFAEHAESYAKIYAALVKAYSQKEHQSLSRNQFFDVLESSGLSNRDIRDLPDSLYFALLDSHESIQKTAMGTRKQERAEVYRSANPASIEIYQAFVDQATLRVKNSDKPRIAVITASSRDPFESADFYLSVFKSLGAEAVWLPLDSVFQQARWLEQLGASGCDSLSSIRASHDSFDRERIYPDRTKLQRLYCQEPALLHDLLKNVQGIFFNGGDQSRTRAALFTPTGEQSIELKIIYKRLHQHAIVVGGTSAGTAVQAGGFANQRPVPMIANGTSEAAMARGAFAFSAPSERCTDKCDNALKRDDLTYNPNGGTGLFSLGLLDTHFSERDREGRLIALASAVEQRMAFGVDETSALAVSLEKTHINFHVLGENGVYVVDRSIAQSQVTQSIEAGGDARQFAALAHYWVGNMTAQYVIETDTWQFSSRQEPLSSRTHFTALDKGQWRDAVRLQCGSKKAIQFGQDGYTVLLQANDATQFYRQQATGRQHCGYIGLPFVIATTR